MKSWLIVLVPILLFGGLYFSGVMKGPAEQPQKKHAKKVGQTEKTDEAAPDDSTAPPADAKPPSDAKPTPETKPTPTAEEVKAPPAAVAATQPPKPTVDPSRGADRLAKIWNEMDASTLQPIVDKWSDDDLAKVLAVMDNGKVVELLGVLKPERASALSRDLQKLASVVPPDKPSK